MSGSGKADGHEVRERVLDIARSARVCMITSGDGAGILQSRPMTPLEVTDEGEIFFLVDTTSDLARQVSEQHDVNLAFAERSAWLSISGRAKVRHDAAKVKDLWNSAAEAWFPDGPEDARLGVLRVKGRSAEYWETQGGRIATALSFIKAKTTGQALDADHDTVRLR